MNIRKNDIIIDNVTNAKYRIIKIERDGGIILNIKIQNVNNLQAVFDIVNMAQIVLDLMQEYEWIEDDNYKNVVPHFNPEVTIDKNNAGVIIKLI